MRLSSAGSFMQVDCKEWVLAISSRCWRLVIWLGVTTVSVSGERASGILEDTSQIEIDKVVNGLWVLPHLEVQQLCSFPCHPF